MPSWEDQTRSALLVLRYRGGDDGALTDLVAIWERRLYYYIRRLVDSEEDAWDLLQEVWCRVIRNLGGMRDDAAFPAWLYTVTRNTVRNHLRDTDHFSELPDRDNDQNDSSAHDEQVLPAFDAEELHRALQRLNVAHREALTLHFLEGFSLDEIAGILAIPPGTVKSRLHYAKKALRRALKNEDQYYE